MIGDPAAPLVRPSGDLRARAVELWARLPGGLRKAIGLLAFGASNFGLARLGLALTPGPASVALFWPSSGLVFGALLVSERRRWPWLLVAASLPIALFNALAGQPPLLVAAFAVTNALEATLASALVRRLCGGRPQLATRTHVLALLLGGPVATSGLCALFSGTVISRVYGPPLGYVWPHIWAGSGLGMIAVSSLILAWSQPETARARSKAMARLEAVALLASFAAVGYVVVLAPAESATLEGVLVLPPLVWTALRYGLRGTTAAGVAFVVLVLGATVLGRGAFAASAGVTGHLLTASQVFGFVVLLTSLFLASAVEDRARADQALRTSEEKYRLLVENQTDLVVKVDAAGHFLFVSPSYCRTFGKSEAELLGKSFMPLVHEEDRESTARAMEALFRPPHAAYMEQRALTVSGWRWFAWADTAILDASGAVVAVVGVGRDVTDRRRVEDRLRQSEKLEAIGRLAGGVAHDFNNQLTAILASTDYLGTLELSGGAGETVLGIREAALRSAGLTRRLLAFSRKQPSGTSTIDVQHVVRDVAELLARSVDKRIAVVTRNEGADAFTSGDLDRLHAAVLNLAINARDAMPEGGTLTISTRTLRVGEERGAALGIPAGPYLEVSVADTGVGMSEEARSHLFEPFFTTKPVGKGSGLGLAEVYGTVQAHRGAVTVTSAPGKGTTVALFLPAVERVASAGAAAPAPAPAPHGRLRVLIVDDEPNVRRSLGLLLRSHGCEVFECAGGRGELRVAAAQPVPLDLAIVDMVMPELTGREAVAEIRAIAPALPVIVSSGYTAEEDIEALCAEPRVFFLQKPYTSEQLGRAMAAATSGAPGEAAGAAPSGPGAGPASSGSAPRERNAG